MIIDGVLR